MHKGITVADNAIKTSKINSSYNETKYGINILDQIAKKYTCRTGTQRWPIHSFQNTLNLAAINACVLFEKITNKKLSRRDFIRTLTEALAYPQVQKQKGISGRALFTISNKNDAQAKKFC